MNTVLLGRLPYLKLKNSELSLLMVASTLCRSGESVFEASHRRLSAMIKRSPRQVKRLLDGYVDPRTGSRIAGLCERGIIQRLSGPRVGRPAVYKIVIDALETDPCASRFLQVVDEDEIALEQLVSEGTA